MRALERDPARRYKTAGEMGDELEALVLRKNYSARALARKARELADQESPAQKVRPTPLAGAAPEIVGREDSASFVDKSRPPQVMATAVPAAAPAAAGPRGLRRWFPLGKAKN